MMTYLEMKRRQSKSRSCIEQASIVNFFESFLNPQQVSCMWKCQEKDDRALVFFVLHIFCKVIHLVSEERELGKGKGSTCCDVGIAASRGHWHGHRHMHRCKCLQVVIVEILKKKLEGSRELLH